MRLAFTVRGTPVPKGSMKAFATPISKKCAICGNAKTRAVVTHDSKKTKPWQLLVRFAAETAMREQGQEMSRGAALGVVLRFFIARPAGHFTTKDGEPTDVPKASAPLFPAKKPDIDKLARTVLDAMQGTVYEEDSRIVSIVGTKHFATHGEPPGVAVSVHDYHNPAFGGGI